MKGILTNMWCASDGTKPQWLKVDLGQSYILSSVRQIFNNSTTWYYKIEGSTNDSIYTVLADHTVNGLTGTDFTDTVSGSYRYVRMTVTNSASGDWATSKEFMVYGGGGGLAKVWEFTSDTEGWTAAYNVNDFAWQTGGYVGGSITGIDPQIKSGTNLGVDITNNKIVKVKMKNSTTSTSAKLYFITNADGTYDESKAMAFTINDNDPSYTEYTVNMTTVSGWTGTLKQVRLDPEDGALSGSFNIDYVWVQN